MIKYAWPEDIWYHVDKESSAHVYIRLPKEEFDAAKKSGDKDWYKKIDEKVVEDCCQLVKANSIKGNKQDNVTVVFTPARYFFQSHNRVHACRDTPLAKILTLLRARMSIAPVVSV